MDFFIRYDRCEHVYALEIWHIKQFCLLCKIHRNSDLSIDQPTPFHPQAAVTWGYRWMNLENRRACLLSHLSNDLQKRKHNRLDWASSYWAKKNLKQNAWVYVCVYMLHCALDANIIMNCLSGMILCVAFPILFSFMKSQSGMKTCLRARVRVCLCVRLFLSGTGSVANKCVFALAPSVFYINPTVYRA